MTTVTIELPDLLAQDARRWGVLEPALLQRLIEAAVRTRKANEFMQTARDLHALTQGETTPSEQDIEAELRAVRQELRRAVGH